MDLHTHTHTQILAFIYIDEPGLPGSAGLRPDPKCRDWSVEQTLRVCSSFLLTFLNPTNHPQPKLHKMRMSRFRNFFKINDLH